MNIELKRAIVNHIFDNINEFSLHNSLTDKFKAYIYDDEGEYLIGGLEVADFITNAIKLIQR